MVAKILIYFLLLEYLYSLTNEHITIICNEATRMFGFLKRNRSEYKYSTCLKTLHCTLICSLVEYGSIKWSLYRTVQINKIQKIQTFFIHIIQ